MSETIDRGPAAEARPPRWSRTLTIWTLLVFSLAPGAAAAAAREWWHQLPAGVRLSAYILSGILLVAACGLMLTQGDANRGDTET
jgi:hypothetical protein